MSNFLIKSIKAREILDSRGNPTVEVECGLENGIFTASVASGASVGQKEALELRDNELRFGGKGVLKAVKNVNEIIAPRLLDLDIREQKNLDELMLGLDGTPNKANLGANAILPVSMAICRAAATALGQPLYKYISDLAKNRNSLFIPKGFFNVINGGAHAGNDLDFQEFMLVPQSESFSENLRMASETYYKLKKILMESYSAAAINVGDEGGFAPPIDSPEVALSLISQAIERANFYGKIEINLDIAASQFCCKKQAGYYQTKMGVFNRDDFIDYYKGLLNNYRIIGLEDPFAEDDWEGFAQITEQLGRKIMIIGDDLLATNLEYIKKAQKEKVCNTVLLKLNQIGTVTECINAANAAKASNWKTIVSHRSGETTDDFIADLAVGLGADGLKAGAPARGERLVKYNRLLKIETELYN